MRLGDRARLIAQGQAGSALTVVNRKNPSHRR
jgi:hypothetical protein